MAATRSTTGSSKPRQVAYEVKEAATKPGTSRKKSTATKKTAATKANTSKPRAKKTAAGKVTKPAAAKKSAASTAKKAAPKKATTKAAPATTAEEDKAEPVSEPTLLEKIENVVEGVALKVQGTILGKPGKKAAGTTKIRKAMAGKTAKAAA